MLLNSINLVSYLHSPKLSISDNSVILLFIIDKFYRFGNESAMFMILLILLLFKINVLSLL